MENTAHIETHFVPFDAMKIGRHQRALCGEMVRSKEHTNEPTCTICRHEARMPPLASVACDDTNLFEIEPDLAEDPNGFVDDALSALITHGGVIEAPTAALAPVVPFPAPAKRTLEDLEDRATLEPTLVTDSRPIIEQALTLQVVDAGTCLQGEQIFDTLRSFEQAAHDLFDEDCDLAHKLWKRLTDKRGAVLKPIEAARKRIGDFVASFKVAEKEREDAAHRERERLAREEQEAAARRNAKQLLATGQVEAAAEVIAEAQTAPLPIVEREPTRVPSTGSTTTRKKWIAEIADWPTLRAAIGEGKYPEFDEAIRAAVLPLLNAQASTLKTSIAQRYPGAIGRQKAGLAGR